MEIDPMAIKFTSPYSETEVKLQDMVKGLLLDLTKMEEFVKTKVVEKMFANPQVVEAVVKADAVEDIKLRWYPTNNNVVGGGLVSGCLGLNIDYQEVKRVYYGIAKHGEWFKYGIAEESADSN